MMLGPKLVVLAAVLSAVALAAPRNEFVSDDFFAPEEALIQSAAKTSSAVAMLKQQFHALEVQLKSDAKITPAVAKVINEMIKMVTDEIEPSIKMAHNADQSEINAKHRVMVDFNAAQKTVRDGLYETGRQIQKDSLAHNNVALEWDHAAKAYLASITYYQATCKSKTDTCCDKQQAAIPAIQYTPAFAKCDYTAANAAGCTKRAQKAAAAAVSEGFGAGLARYTALKGGCSSEAVRLTKAFKDMSAKNDHCDDKEADARARKKLLKTQKKQFRQDWRSSKKTYFTGIKKAEKSYKKARKKIKQHGADRRSEWRSTQEIKCLLQNYQAGGTFDEASMNTCKAKIRTEHLVVKYPEIPDRLVWTRPKFTKLVDWSSYSEDCHKTWDKTCEEADKHCTLIKTPPTPVCKPGTPAPGQNGTGGPRWKLSAAAKKFAK